MRRIRTTFIILVITTFLFEFVSVFYCNIFEVCKNPTYRLSKQKPTHFLDSNKIFGTWHEPNSIYFHKNKCINAKYKFNSYGARDVERLLKGKDRTILIGDSFVEGYGINFENTIGSILEKLTNKEFLNFGTSGHFGTTQYKLLYESLAKNFEHDKLVVFLTVDNDFEDDSYEFGKVYHKNRYRPYLLKNNDNYKIIYFNEEKFNYTQKSKQFIVLNLLNNFTYSYNLLRYFYQQLKLKNEISKYNEALKTIKSNNEKETDFYYNNFTKDSFDILSYNLLEINNLTKKNGIDFYLFSIGFKNEMKKYFTFNKKTKLEINLEKLANENNFKYVDLTSLIKKNYNKDINNLFLSCNNHFNKFGNEILTNLILNNLSNE